MSDDVVAALKAAVRRFRELSNKHEDEMNKAMDRVSLGIQVTAFSLVIWFICWHGSNGPAPKFPPLVHWFDKVVWYCFMATGPAVLGCVAGALYTRIVAIRASNLGQREIHAQFGHLYDLISGLPSSGSPAHLDARQPDPLDPLDGGEARGGG